MTHESENKPSQAEGGDDTVDGTEEDGRFVLPTDDKPSQAEGDDDGGV